MGTGRHEIGMIGLGVMGRNVLLNMADHGFLVAGYDKDPRKVEALRKESAANDIHAAAKIQDLIGLLRRPRAVMMPVPAGPPIDFPNYAGGTWGPDATQGLPVQRGHSWPAPVELAGRSPRRSET